MIICKPLISEVSLSVWRIVILLHILGYKYKEIIFRLCPFVIDPR